MEVHCYICHSPLVVMVCAIYVSSLCVSSLFISESHQMLKHPTELWFDHLASPHSPKSSKTGNAVMPPRSWCHHVKAKLTFEVENLNTKRNVCCVITALSIIISYIYRQVIALNSRK